MNDTTQIDALQGQVAALHKVLSSLISTLTPLQRAQMAVTLEIQRQESLKSDQAERVPQHETSARDSITQAYLNLLKSPSL